MITASDIAKRLGLKAKGKTFEGRCPAHDDNVASFAASTGDRGQTLMHCHAGCSLTDVCAALDIVQRDLWPQDGPRIDAEYDYVDENGELLFQVLRMWPKAFRQRRPDGDGWQWSVKGVRRVLYRLPQLLAADPALPVFFVEGEKDVHRLEAEGLIATTVPGGASRWSDAFAPSLSDRRVVVLPDNDDAGRAMARQVRDGLTDVAESVVVIELDGLPRGGDVSDWLASHSRDELLSIIAEASTTQEPQRASVPLLQSMRERRELRMAREPGLIPTGVDYIDDRLHGGLMRESFCLLSGGTGTGKTELLLQIMRASAQAGRRALLVYLEGYRGEASERLVFNELQRLAQEASHPGCWDMSFREFTAGVYRDDIEAKFLDAAERSVAEWADGLRVIYRGDRFCADDIIAQMLPEKDDVDLFLFDHVHYVDSDDANENRALGEITKALNSVAQRGGCPVIAVAHIRKSQGPRKSKLIVPSAEELHGSSDLSKIVTEIITLAPHPDMSPSPWKAATICRIDKDRADGAGDPFVGVMFFDRSRRRYDPGYVLARLVRGGEGIEPMNSEHDQYQPRWARRATQWQER